MSDVNIQAWKITPGDRKCGFGILTQGCEIFEKLFPLWYRANHRQIIRRRAAKCDPSIQLLFIKGVECARQCRNSVAQVIDVGEMIFCPQRFGCFLKVKCGTGAMKPAFCCFKSGPDITRAAQHGIELFTGLGGWQVRDLAADGFNRKIRRLCKPLRIIGIGNNQRRRRLNHSIFLIVYRPKIFLLLQRNSDRLADDTDIGMLDQRITQQVWVDPASRWKKKSWIVNGYASESRSEEHTSELQSRENLVCRLLLEKK